MKTRIGKSQNEIPELNNFKKHLPYVGFPVSFSMDCPIWMLAFFTGCFAGTGVSGYGLYNGGYSGSETDAGGGEKPDWQAETGRGAGKGDDGGADLSADAGGGEQGDGGCVASDGYRLVLSGGFGQSN